MIPNWCPLKKKQKHSIFKHSKKIKKSAEAFNSHSFLMTINSLSLKLAGHKVHKYASFGQVHLEG